MPCNSPAPVGPRLHPSKRGPSATNSPATSTPFQGLCPALQAPGPIVAALIIGLALASAAILLGIGTLAARSYRRPVVSGSEEMIGAPGTVTSAAGNDSWWVTVHGENWRARSNSALRPGSQVRVTRRDGLTLHVSPIDTHTTTGGTS